MKKTFCNVLYLLIGFFTFFVQFVQAQEKLSDSENYEYATFASGCFWCTQYDFDQIKGVISTKAGYTGGEKVNPSYQEVSSGTSGHIESLQVKYDPEVVSYQELLDVYWHTVDPTRNDGQFCDKGSQYRPVIFYHNENQQKLAEKSKEQLIATTKIKPILVEILPAKTFYPAEEYHQEYYKKNPLRYKFYRYNCGRDARLKEIWGTPKI